MIPPQKKPIVCFAHLRWSFVYQRPQQILSRLASERDVYYVEEPLFEEGDAAEGLNETRVSERITVLTPVLRAAVAQDPEQSQARVIRAYLLRRGITEPILWYYTPMAIGATQNLSYSACVYDCMDELSMFAFAPAQLQQRERELFSKANVVFTGGRSLYYRKRKNHGNVHCLPSAVDARHFAQAGRREPADLAGLAHPRFGFYGVIDERFDREFLAAAAALRPEWQFVIVGPVVKIDAATLPRARNIHYTGQRSYDELPAYLEHWDVAMQPFARNDATRFISPTKTLEYLAAHKPVISTPITDVVDPYGKQGLVAIAATPEEFAAIGDRMLSEPLPPAWHERVARTVAENSWDAVASRIDSELEKAATAAALA
jgi:UDP-galactopyranose mutase